MRPLCSLLVLLSALAQGEEPQPAVLHLSTSPPGAAITIDGKLVGLSPRSETLSPGVHTLSAEQSGAIAAQTISLIEGEERKLTLFILPPLTPRTAPVAGLVTFGGGALVFGLGLLLQLPAREAGREVSLLYQRGGGWDDQAQRLEQSGLSAQTWSWFLAGAGVAIMASGLVVMGVQLFGRRADLPVLALSPIFGGGLLTWGANW